MICWKLKHISKEPTLQMPQSGMDCIIIVQSFLPNFQPPFSIQQRVNQYSILRMVGRPSYIKYKAQIQPSFLAKKGTQTHIVALPPIPTQGCGRRHIKSCLKRKLYGCQNHGRSFREKNNYTNQLEIMQGASFVKKYPSSVTYVAVLKRPNVNVST